MRKIVMAIIFLAIVMTGTTTVFAQTPAQNQIVIIPGIGASWNTNIMTKLTSTATTTGWGFTPTVHPVS